MLVVILAGGKGTRLSEYTNLIPKPMVKVDGKPLIQHIIKHYKSYGFKKFLIAGGYKFNVIKKYFNNDKEVEVVNTGLNSLTSKRVYNLKKYLKNQENFLLTYGDGVSDIDLNKLIKFHKKNKSILTISVVRPPARFGELKLNNNTVTRFDEKPQLQSGWINGGFFVVNNKFLKFVRNKNEMLERAPIIEAVKTKKVRAFKHESFWKCVDNKRDLDQLNHLIKMGRLKSK